MNGTTPPIVNPPPPAPTPPGNENWALKEVVGSLLSLAIMIVTLGFLVCMFRADANVADTVWQHQTSILATAVSLAGTVTGYYFGRLPAERAAATAQQAATSAQQSLGGATALAQQATANETRIRTQVGSLHAQISTPLGGGTEGAEDSMLRSHVQQGLLQILRG